VTHLTRRGFLEGAAASSALYAASIDTLWAREARGKPVALSLGDRLALITGGGGNVLVFGADEGALLVDGGNAASAAAVVKLALEEAHAKQVHTLFNTHWHPDQTGSNDKLGRQGARIIAQENTRLWLTRKVNVDWLAKPHPAFDKVAQPNRTFYTTDKLGFGGEQFGFGHLGQAHTDGDLYVQLAKANVLAAGGVVSSAGWPLLDWQTGGWIGGLVGAHDRLIKVANDDTRVIPADGPMVGMKELKEYRW
jgi:cyclase